MIYYLIYIICLIGAVLGFQPKFKKHQNKILIILGLFLILAAGLRNQTGFDFSAYVMMFDATPEISELFSRWGVVDVEGGYFLLNSIIKTMGLSVHVVLLVIALATISILIFSFKKYSAYPIMALLLYVSRFYFVRDMGQIRSSLASAIVLLSIGFIYKKKPWKFILLVFIAASFHLMAILAIPLYLMSIFFKKGISTKLAIGIIISSLVIGLIDLERIILSIEPFIPERYLYYVTNEYYAFPLGLTNPVLFMQLMILSTMLFFRKDIKNKYFEILLNGYLLSTAILAALNHFGTIAGRLSTLFATFEVLIIVLFIDVFDEKSLREVIKDLMQKIGFKKNIHLSRNAIMNYKFKKIVYSGILFYSMVIFGLIFVYQTKPYYMPYRWVFEMDGNPFVEERMVRMDRVGFINYDANFQTGPGSDRMSTDLLVRGTEVRVIGTTTDWWKVNVDGREGWVNQKQVEIIEDADVAMDEQGFINMQINFRTGPSLDNFSMGVFQSGTEVQIIGRTGNWRKIKINDQEGWIVQEAVETIEKAETITEEQGITNMQVNFRTGPDFGNLSLGLRQPGTELQIIGMTDEWLRVNIDGQDGWIIQEAVDVIEEIEDQGIVNMQVNFRIGPDLERRSLGLKQPGTELQIMGMIDGWFKVNIDGEEGWIIQEAINIID